MSFIVLLLSSCTPVMRVNVVKQKEYPPLELDAQFAIYNKPQQIPVEYETIGEIQLICGGDFTQKTDTTKCDSIFVFRAAETRAKGAGGNALLLKKFKKPTIWNSGYLLQADVIKIFDFSSPPDLLYIKRKPRIFEIYGKGTWDLRLSFPYINHFILKPDGEKDISSTGFIGAAIGFDYYHQNSQYLNIMIGAVMDLFAPIPIPICYDVNEYREVEFCSSYFIGVTNNHRYKYFSLGYGLSYSHNLWRHNYGNYDVTLYDKKYTDNTLGLMLTSYWFFNRSFCLGIIYRPSFLRLNTSPTFKYEHLISIDLAWRIRLKTVAKQK